jgi:hypothetical protein
VPINISGVLREETKSADEVSSSESEPEPPKRAKKEKATPVWINSFLLVPWDLLVLNIFFL